MRRFGGMLRVIRSCGRLIWRPGGACEAEKRSGSSALVSGAELDRLSGFHGGAGASFTGYKLYGPEFARSELALGRAAELFRFGGGCAVLDVSGQHGLLLH